MAGLVLAIHISLRHKPGHDELWNVGRWAMRGPAVAGALCQNIEKTTPCKVTGGRALEYWIPAEDLPAFNAAIVGPIEIISRFP
ncbi:hypothetical protein J2R80_004565 [Bradyrhizobium sp. USDA 4541]|nr:hypothetical protein [Bradyrhizobium sp. USDA 4541]